MKITIDNVIESTDYSVLNKPVRMLDVHYTTETGYKGAKKMKKDDFDPKTIGQVLKADADHVSSMIGKDIEVK